MYVFTARGHPNIRATHPTTLEFTKDVHLTTQGDCIVGVSATFGKELKKVLSKPQITIKIEAAGKTEIIRAIPNPSFSSDHELVIRTTSFISERTFATRAGKAAKDISREFIGILRKPETTITISID